MPKRVPEGAKRVPLNCLVLPETLAWLKSFGGSQGVAIDLAVAALKTQEAQARVMAETGDPWKVANLNTAIAETERKPRLSWKRGPRPKGDTTR